MRNLDQAVSTQTQVSQEAQELLERLHAVGSRLLSSEIGGLESAQGQLLLLEHLPMALALHERARAQVEDDEAALVDDRLVHQLKLLLTEVSALQERARQQVLTSLR